jgi:hypothetical protein
MLPAITAMTPPPNPDRLRTPNDTRMAIMSQTTPTAVNTLPRHPAASIVTFCWSAIDAHSNIRVW